MCSLSYVKLLFISDSYGFKLFVWILMDSQRFPRICMDSYGFLGMPMDSYGSAIQGLKLLFFSQLFSSSAEPFESWECKTLCVYQFEAVYLQKWLQNVIHLTRPWQNSPNTYQRAVYDCPGLVLPELSDQEPIGNHRNLFRWVESMQPIK